MSSSLAKGACFPADLLSLLLEDNFNLTEVEMNFHCFSLQFTCRARGQRHIPFWVTHTSTELSTKGQASGINSLLAWTYIKPLSTFFTLTTFQQWPRLGHPCPWRFVRIQLNKVLHNRSDLRANPAGNRGLDWRPPDTPWSLHFPMNLLPWASSSDLIELMPEHEVKKKAGRAASANCPRNQFRHQNLQRWGDDLGTSPSATNTLLCWKVWHAVQ